MTQVKSAILIGLNKYPEFKDAVTKITAATLRSINLEAEKIQSEMPYKVQFLLEEIIKNLEERV